MPISTTPFGTLPDGREVTAYTLTNPKGIALTAMDYGCTIISLLTPDQYGRLGDIVLGFDSLQGYLDSPYYFGAVIGRCANRIANHTFSLDGREIKLSGPYTHHLHGGSKGFDKVLWRARPFDHEQGVGIDFSYVSPDGEEGYPGNLEVTARYLLTDNDALIINFIAHTDQPTIVNLTQHSYFNLDGGDSWVLNHALFLNSDYFLPIDQDRLPTGVLQPVADTPMDFSNTKIINDAFQWSEPQLQLAQGLDHCWILTKGLGELGPAATLYGPSSRRKIEIHTSEPAIQVYTGNSIEATGKNQQVYKPYAGIALETQHYPDAPHHPDFPSIVVRPEQPYESTTIWLFGILPGRG